MLIKAFNCDRERLSFSEPDLPESLKYLDRFAVKHLHEYVTVDELKFYRRRRPPEYLTKSNICLSDSNKHTVLPFSPLKSEYKRCYIDLQLPLKTLPIRRATSLHLECHLMPLHRTEHQDRYLWFAPEDCKSARSYPMKRPESLRLSGGFNMEPEYRSSYIMYPMVDRTTKILPREVFTLQSPASTTQSVGSEVIQKLNEDRALRDKARDQQHECHLQKRANTDESKFNASPTEYQTQFVPQLVAKAQSIPQISHIKIQGEFETIPEYQDCFKMYANYVKPKPIIKNDNLLMSGSEIQMKYNKDSVIPEYREKFHDLSQDVVKGQPLQTNDHLKPNGKFPTNVPEYFESFRDPQVKQVPEKSKCRESCLHLKGKLEFNPEYRNTYLDFPRCRPTVPKPSSTFRLPTSNSTSTPSSSANRRLNSPHNYRNTPQSTPSIVEPETDITITPEYRRASYNYQIRERSPKQKAIAEASAPKNTNKIFHRKSIPGLDHIGREYGDQKTPKFGRRAGESILKHTKNSNIAGNTKYTMTQREDVYNSKNIHDSFVVLENKPCKRVP